MTGVIHRFKLLRQDNLNKQNRLFGYFQKTEYSLLHFRVETKDRSCTSLEKPQQERGFHGLKRGNYLTPSSNY